MASKALANDPIDYRASGELLDPARRSERDRFRYAETPLDEAIGLSYHYARRYDPAAGRLVTAEPTGFNAGDENLYRYVGNDPTDFTDPDGMKKKLKPGHLQMARILVNSFPILVALATVGAGAEQQQARVRAMPDHLVPVDPYPSERHAKYVKRCNELLGVEEFESVQLFQYLKRGSVVMVRRPSFDPEECIALREESGARAYTLIYTRADRNIFHSMAEDAEKRNHVSVKVVRVTKPFDRNRAQRVYDLWDRMLRSVRYAERDPLAGCPDDAETFEFRYAWKGMYGETCSPSEGAPKMLADLGSSLILCCRSQGDEVEKNLNVLEKKCEELERYLDGKRNLNEGQSASGKAPEQR